MRLACRSDLTHDCKLQLGANGRQLQRRSVLPPLQSTPDDLNDPTHFLHDGIVASVASPHEVVRALLGEDHDASASGTRSGVRSGPRSREHNAVWVTRSRRTVGPVRPQE